MSSKFAVISDIHGNVFALEAVLNDINSKGIELIYNLGDIFYGPLLPVDTYEKIINIKNMISIAGNGDRMLLSPINNSDSFTSLQNKKSLSTEHLLWLSQLRGCFYFGAIGLKILITRQPL